MKKIIYLFLTATIFFYNNSNAQEETKVDSFEVTENNPNLINQFVVITKDSMTIEEGYKLVNRWINLVYNSSTEVIRSKIENEYIRIEVEKTKYPCDSLRMKTCYDSKYSISFAFKQDKIKFQVTRLQLNYARSKSSTRGWSNYSPTYAFLYNKNGKPIKEISIAEGLMATLNEMKNDLGEFIINPIKEETSESGW